LGSFPVFLLSIAWPVTPVATRSSTGQKNTMIAPEHDERSNDWRFWHDRCTAAHDMASCRFPARIACLATSSVTPSSPSFIPLFWNSS